jgi:hypothetical protein
VIKASALLLMMGCVPSSPVEHADARIAQPAPPTSPPDRSGAVWQHPGWRSEEWATGSSVPLVCGHPPWREQDLRSAERELHRELAASEAGRAPSHTYETFVRWNDAWPVYDGFRCRQDRGGNWERKRYDLIWSGLRSRERERLTFGEAREAREAFTRLYEEHWAAALQRSAVRRGFAEARVGLRDFLREARDEAWPATRVRSVAVMSSDSDHLNVVQVMRHQALVAGEELTLLIPSSDRVYEGASLSSVARTVQVTGTTTYQSLDGPRQAFLVEPIADLDDGVNVHAALDAVASIAAGGRLALAEYDRGRPRQCLDFDPAKLSAKLTPEFGATIAAAVYSADPVIFLPTCSVFTAEPLTRCALPSGGVVVAFEDLGEDAPMDAVACQKVGGVWQGALAPKR